MLSQKPLHSSPPRHSPDGFKIRPGDMTNNKHQRVHGVPYTALFPTNSHAEVIIMNYINRFRVKPGSKVDPGKVDASFKGKHESHEHALPEIEARLLSWVDHGSLGKHGVKHTRHCSQARYSCC